MMKFTRVAALALAIAGMGIVASDVACTKEQGARVMQDLSSIGSCVLNQIEAGAQPLQVLAACAGSTLASIIDIVETFLAGAPMGPDGSAGDSPRLNLYKTFLADAKALKAGAAK